MSSVTSSDPTDRHGWLSFEDPDEQRTWLFDLTFLLSDWTCIFGRGCKGVLTEDSSDAVQGCCSYGAHLTGAEDARRTAERAERLTASQWQFRDIGARDGVIETGDDGTFTTRLVDDACIFLNRPGFDGDGLGCAFHHAARAAGLGHVDLMPEVCWQLPIRRIDTVEDGGHVISTVREWKRRDWGDGGADFHWWCTDSPEAFIGARPVLWAMEAELRATVGDTVYELLVNEVLEQDQVRETPVAIPHPARRSVGQLGD